MIIDEAEWNHAHEALRAVIDERAAATVMAALPRHEPATKADLEALEERLDTRFDGLRSELRGEMSELRSELRGEMAGLRADTAAQITGLRGEMIEGFGNVRTEMADLRVAVSDTLQRHLLRVTAWNSAVMLGAIGLALGVSRLG